MATAESVVRPHSIVARSTDRRGHARAALEGPVLVDAFSTWQRARCENVSASGVLLSCDAELPVGKTVELYFELPSGVAIETRALVIRSKEGVAALRFVDLDRDSELALRAHCRSAALARLSSSH